MKKQKITKEVLQSNVGNTFGKYTILEFIEDISNNGGKSYNHKYKCRCKCGKETIILGRFVLYGKTKQCINCHNKENGLKAQKNITGQRFGKLVALKQSRQTKSQNWFWLCVCDCGEQYEAEMRHLFNGTTAMCKKCLYKNKEKDDLNWYLTKCKAAAKNRNIIFNLNLNDLEQQYQLQNGLCLLSGRPLSKASWKKCKKNNQKCNISLDRIDSSKGYEIGNIQWVHKNINFAKNDLTTKEFIQLCQDVVNYQKQLGNI